METVKNIIVFDKVSKVYHIGEQEVRALDEASMYIREHEFVSIIGPSGSGKSTMMKMLVGLHKPASGEVFIHGESIRKKKTEDLSRKVSLVYQNPEEMFIKDSIKSDIDYAMRVRDISEHEERTASLIERFRLTDLSERDGRLMSGRSISPD